MRFFIAELLFGVCGFVVMTFLRIGIFIIKNPYTVEIIVLFWLIWNKLPENTHIVLKIVICVLASAALIAIFCIPYAGIPIQIANVAFWTIGIMHDYKAFPDDLITRVAVGAVIIIAISAIHVYSIIRLKDFIEDVVDEFRY